MLQKLKNNLNKRLYMTRVNIIPPKELMDQHLMAEFREIRHVGPSLQRSLKSKSKSYLNKPEKYTLNKGHVTFFYDKGMYLYKRFQEIKEELLRRGFNINRESNFDISLFPPDFQKDWEPTECEKLINVERINLRIQQKPNFYRRS